MSKSTDVYDRFARAVAADRNFEAAATSYLEAFVNWRRTLGGFNKVVSSGARQRIMKSILCLHFGNATENPDDGATFERLLGLSNPADREETCGPRVLRTVIALAQRSGHLAVTTGWYDRRLKILRPTDKWIALEAERHEVALASLGLLQQDRSRFALRPSGAALVGRLAVASGRAERAPSASRSASPTARCGRLRRSTAAWRRRSRWPTPGSAASASPRTRRSAPASGSRPRRRARSCGWPATTGC